MPQIKLLPTNADVNSALILAELKTQTALLCEIVSALTRGPRADALIETIENIFDRGTPFTANGLLAVAEEAPHGELANALASLIDYEGTPHSRATQLGILLSRLPQIEVMGHKRGVTIFCLRA